MIKKQITTIKNNHFKISVQTKFATFAEMNETACKNNEIGVPAYLGELPYQSDLMDAYRSALERNVQDKLFYFHANHLGSGSLITDNTGKTYQTLAYAPYGESLVNIRHYNSYYYNEPHQFGGHIKDEESGLIYMGARSLDTEIGIEISTDPKWDKFPHLSPYNAMGNNPIMYVDPDGRKIVLAGSVADRQIALTHLQKLTNDKLSMRSDGTVIIARMGGENSGKALTNGSELIRDLNKKDNGAKTVTISIGAPGSGNSESHYRTNATNGIGTDATVNFDPTSNPSIPTKDPTTGNVSGATRPNEIGLGHELIHADRAMKGKSVDRATTAAHAYKDAAGNAVTQTRPKEELETVGVQGNHKYNENKLRKEQGLNERGAY